MPQVGDPFSDGCATGTVDYLISPGTERGVIADATTQQSNIDVDPQPLTYAECTSREVGQNSFGPFHLWA